MKTEKATSRKADIDQIHDEMNLGSLQPLVCDTRRGRKLQEQCGTDGGRNVNHHARNI